MSQGNLLSRGPQVGGHLEGNVSTPDRQKLVKSMNQSACSQVGDWNCISPGYEALTCYIWERKQVYTSKMCSALWRHRKEISLKTILLLARPISFAVGVIIEDSNKGVGKIIRPKRFPCNSARHDGLHIHLLHQELLYCEDNHSTY
jgi:hypothetical protein